MFETDVLAEIFGTGTLLDVVYAVIGIAALTFVPRVLGEIMDMGHDHGPRPHHA